ncbi:hypothetical protein SAMN05660653_01012 [Desulfonatronum thiosulfatophilum]|uniref:Uncharacterized protein n=1 Tax=Desulfonatronum thiosulfatophilum TaxID=617002 RepID=A0A1G6BKM5_9BACT|nr:hypothetical protein [Desulfonatronum thiosulfatophilum]SDB21135.1 hypothetical protein SAMN05660653_01012 [Desulfonatronum thiosulfatophilum]
MRSVLHGVLLIAVILLIHGCTHRHGTLPVLSQIPVPTAYPLRAQQKMQAMHHWEVLADDVAGRVHKSLERHVMERQFPIYVAPSGTTPFAKSFHSLLITRLVERNIAVTGSFSNAMILSFDLDMVRHGDRFVRTGSGLYKALAPDVFVQRASLLTPDGHGALINQALMRSAEADVDAGVYTSNLPRTEVMITSSLLFDDDFLMRDTSIYYINDSEWWHYKQHILPREPGVVTFHLVDR